MSFLQFHQLKLRQRHAFASIKCYFAQNKKSHGFLAREIKAMLQNVALYFHSSTGV